uniref:SprT-like domain-containing protein n=1 Tax=Parascaris univalens TaxID=6257 RepID=A0A915C442_PARUN
LCGHSFAMPRHLRRIVLDDSSDASMISLQSGSNNSSKNLVANPETAVVDGMNSACSMEQSIRELSRGVENMSVVELREMPEVEQKSRSGVWECELEVDDGDEDEYVEDSFLVKDSECEDDDASLGFECDEISAINELPTALPRRTVKPAKYMESTPLRRGVVSLKDLTTEKTQKSMLASLEDEESRRLLVEIYPELKDATIASDSSTGQSKKSPAFSFESEKDYEEEDKEESGEDEESFEKYLKKLKGNRSAEEDDELRCYNDDLDDFIVDDNEPLYDENGSEDEENDDSGRYEISLRDVLPHHLFLPPHRRHRHKEKENKKGPVLLIPSHEKERKRRHLIKIFSTSSPMKEILRQSNRKSDMNEKLSDEERFLMALTPGGPKHPEAESFIKTKFARIRDRLTRKLFDIYRRRCFEGKLDEEMKIEWNNRLRLTAGRCRCMRNGSASIELSVKVCNSPERVRDTLLHELCHAAVWVIDRVANGGHGPVWKYWAMRCVAVFSSLPPIERCHNYRIDAKFLYVCNRCGQTIRRHTKSLDTERKICALCQGRFELQRSDGRAIETTKRINRFAEFVKGNYAEVKKAGMKHGEVMKILSQKFKEKSEGKTEEDGDEKADG